jgi:hypothetical protein
MAERPQGYLVLTAIEGSGRNKDDNFVWGAEGETFDGYVKGGLGWEPLGAAVRRSGGPGGAVRRAARAPACALRAPRPPPAHWRPRAAAAGRHGWRQAGPRAGAAIAGGARAAAAAAAAERRRARGPRQRASMRPLAPTPRRRPPAPPAPPSACAVELRGGARNVKVATRRAPVQGSTIFWNEPLVL